MPNFKLKPKKVVNEEEIVTLDTIHQKFTKYFKARKNSTKSLKDDLEKKELELKALEEKNPAEYTNDDIHDKAYIKNEIYTIKSKLYDIENDHTELDYYSLVGSDLMEYYELQNKQMKLSRDDDNIYRNVQQKVEDDEEEYDLSDHPLKRTKVQKKPVKKRTKNVQKENNKESILSFINGDYEKNKKPKIDEQKTNKKKLFNNYLFKIDDNYVNNLRCCEDIISCPTCKIERVINSHEGVVVCQKCGLSDTIVIEPEKQSNKEPVHEKPGCPYQKINHLNEWLSQTQAKETADIQPEVYDKIIKKIRSMRLKVKDITPEKMKQILKELDLTEDYEHVPYIISKITGKPAPKFTREMEEKIRQMFKEMQEPFERYCPPERTNFLNYSYVLHKSCELLELDEYLPYFPLLKSRENLRNQDEIWKKICYDLRWEFIPSI